MNKTEFEQLRDAVEDAFTSLYVIDVGSLSAQDKVRHQEALSAAYLAVVRLENAVFSQLTDTTKIKLEQLASAAATLQAQLAGLKKATATLGLVSDALNVFTSIAKLLK